MAADESEPADGRRLIIIVVEPGMTPGIEYEGEFATYEILAALNEAVYIVSVEDEEEADKEEA